MKLGIIDLGSNSVKFFVYEFTRNFVPKKIHKIKFQTQLAKDLFKSGKISSNSIIATKDAVQKFTEYPDFFKLDKLIAVGTSALRTVTDQSLKEDLEKIIGQEITLLSGKEEANLIANGFIFKNSKLLGNSLIIDIGGGSTEVAIIENDKVINNISLPFGAIRVQENYLKTYPPEEISLSNLKNDISKELETFSKSSNNLYIENAYGLSGGIKTLFKLFWINDEHLTNIPYDDIYKLFNKVKKMSLSEISQINGLPPERIHILLGGFTILISILEYFKIKNLVWDKSTLKDGVVAKEYEFYCSKS